MNNEILKNAVAQVIKENGNEEITGNILQQVLIAMINSLGLGFQFIGEAKPDTNPGTPDARVFYFAQDAGTYSNFDGLVLDGSSVAVFLWSDQWAHIVVNIPTTPGLDARYLRIANLASSTGESTTTAMTQKAVTDALAQMLESITTALTEKVDKEPGKGLSSNDYTTPEKQKLAALPTNTQLQETLNTKADKDTSAVVGNLAKFNANGNPVDSGISAADIITRQELNPNARRGLAEAVVDTDSEGTGQEFTFRQSGGDGGAFYRRILGKTLVWNQLVKNGNFSDGLTEWTVAPAGTGTVSNGEVTVTSVSETSSGNLNIYTTNSYSIPEHKYLVTLEYFIPSTNTSLSTIGAGLRGNLVNLTTVDAWTKHSVILSVNNSRNLFITANIDVASVGDYYKLRKINVIDLTLMFGAGNEPSTVAEFEALYPNPYYAYNPGALISNDAVQVETTGFNQWDEEWELGMINPSNGGIVGNNSAIRSKNFIPVLPNGSYYLHSNIYIVCGYDANKNFVKRYKYSGSTAIVAIDSDIRYIKFCTLDTYGGTYNHDLCINLSDPAKNGTYEPYWKRVAPLGLSTLTGKLNGQGASVVVFPDGMNGDGTDRDEIRADGKTADKTRARIDLGSLNWLMSSAGRFYYEGLNKKPGWNILMSGGRYDRFNGGYSWDAPDMTYGASNGSATIYIKDSNYTDAATFKASLNGVYLDYPIATPETYILDEPLPNAIKVDDGGTEQAIQPENAALPSAPFSAIATYTMSIQRMVEKLRSL